jgi:hypothetical protein
MTMGDDVCGSLDDAIARVEEDDTQARV